MNGSHNQWEGISIPPRTREKIKLLLEATDREMGDLERAKADLKDHARAYLSDFFGDRCPDFCPTCVCCAKWKAFDALFSEELFSAKE